MALRSDSARSPLQSKLRRWLRSVSPDRLLDLPARLANPLRRAVREADRPGVQRRRVRPEVSELEPRLQPNDILNYLAGTAIFGSGMLLTGDFASPAAAVARGLGGEQSTHALTTAPSSAPQQLAVVDAALGREDNTAAARTGDTTGLSAGADSTTRPQSATKSQTAGSFDPLSTFNSDDWSGSIESLFGNTASHGLGDHFSTANARTGGGGAVSGEIARATASFSAAASGSGGAAVQSPAADPQSVGVNQDVAASSASKQQPAAATGSTGISPSKPQTATPLGNLPVSFVPNVGQADPSVKFVADASGFVLQLTNSSANFVLPNSGARDASATTLTMKFVGASGSATVVGMDKVSSVTNFVDADAPSTSHYNVPNYAEAVIQNVYPGIDAVFFTNSSHALEYDFIVHAGANPSAINLQWAGSSGISTDARGDLDLKVTGGTLAEQAPAAFQASAGTGQQNVAVSTVLHGNNSVGFQLGAYDTSRELVIDPTVDFSDEWGDAVNAFAFGAAVDDSSGSPEMIYAGSYWNASGPQTSPFYVRLDSNGNILSYNILTLSSQGVDYEASATAVAVDPSGDVYIAGADVAEPGGGPAYYGIVDEFSVNGTFVYGVKDGYDSSIRASVYAYNGIAVDSSGNAYVTGYAQSQPVLRGGQHTAYYAMVAEIPAGGPTLADPGYEESINSITTTAIFSQFGGYGAALDNSGNLYIAGVGVNGGVGAYVWEVADSSGQVEQSRLIGSANAADGICVTENGSVDNVYITGTTGYHTFDTMDGVQPTIFEDSQGHVANADAFLVEYQVNTSNPNNLSFTEVYGTYLGGLGTVTGYGVAVDSAGDITVVGQMMFTPSVSLPSPEFDTVNPLPGDQSYPDNLSTGYSYAIGDGFIAQISGANLTSYDYSTYWGGAGPYYDTATGEDAPADSSAQAVALDPSGHVYIAGWTDSQSLSGGNTAASAEELTN